MKKKSDKIKLVVNGEKVKIPLTTLEIKSVDKSMRQISSKIARWGKVLAEAERERDMTNAFYRQWRARRGKEINAKGKLSEWKLNQQINSETIFLELKQTIADAEFNVSVLARFYEALNKQAFILPSLGAKKRSELKSMGMTTKR